MLDSLFPRYVVVESADPAEVDGPLFEEEERAVARAVNGRRIEYRAGRVLARRALERIGCTPQAILSGADRAPIWPANVVGTITHTRGLCAVAVARSADVASLGCDVERTRRMREGVIDKVLTEGERARLGRGCAAFRAVEATLLFSAKEAFYKCLYPLRPRFVGFQEVEVELDLERSTFQVLAPQLSHDGWPERTRFEGRFAWNEEFVQTAVTAHRL
ncbi:MAG: 4'-phosphopantetheinyl transferase superfamily protein [Planctomycetes bacterium]|nr:4'-phosphopantetheinyl transferase superfamily protein [Planctomycetota bacterium]